MPQAQGVCVCVCVVGGRYQGALQQGKLREKAAHTFLHRLLSCFLVCWAREHVAADPPCFPQRSRHD